MPPPVVASPVVEVSRKICLDRRGALTRSLLGSFSTARGANNTTQIVAAVASSTSRWQSALLSLYSRDACNLTISALSVHRSLPQFKDTTIQEDGTTRGREDVNFQPQKVYEHCSLAYTSACSNTIGEHVAAQL